MCASRRKKQELDYLTELVTLMIKEDQDTLGLNAVDIPACSFEYIRFLPTISKEFSNPKGTKYPNPLTFFSIPLTYSFYNPIQ
jgi:hypothetical protein